MQPALWQQLNDLTDHLINVFETVNQPTYCKQLPVTSTTELDGSNRIKSTRTINVSETNLKCLSTAFVIFFMLIIKVATNKHERVRNKVFLHIYYITDDVIFKETYESLQQEKVPMLWCSGRSPRGN